MFKKGGVGHCRPVDVKMRVACGALLFKLARNQSSELRGCDSEILSVHAKPPLHCTVSTLNNIKSNEGWSRDCSGTYVVIFHSRGYPWHRELLPRGSQTSAVFRHAPIGGLPKHGIAEIPYQTPDIGGSHVREAARGSHTILKGNPENPFVTPMFPQDPLNPESPIPLN